jgi:para-aminobenzoate synthetase component 1
VTVHNIFTIIPCKSTLLKFSKAITARAYYKNYFVDLLTGQKHPAAISLWLTSLEVQLENQKSDKKFIHLFYELGFLFENIDVDIEEREMLAIEIQYAKVETEVLKKQSKKIELTKVSAPIFSEYKKQFEKGHRELSEGNCYQFNLTGEYIYSFDKDVLPYDFISTLWSDSKKRGAYGSATYIDSIGKLFLSNSPECLFHYSKGSLISRPIKGTFRLHNNDKKEIQKVWDDLSTCKKSQGELYMITDLLRNDLSRIDLPVAEVTKKKALLLVPGLVHQYSEIKVKLRSHVTLRQVLEKIFPGGSITGAPKKRVMEILKNLELRSRGFYCGSTLIFSPDCIEASINIRASVIDFEKGILSYQAGGGITLMSEALAEFEEMTYKHNSYIDILTL